MRSIRFGRFVGLGIGLVLASTACTAADAVSSGLPQSGQTAGRAKASWLFVLQARSGRMTPVGDAWRLELATDDRAVAFTDRPAREAATVGTPALVGRIGAMVDPPNATLLVEDPAGEDDATVAVELTGATFDAASGRATFRARPIPLGGNAGALGLRGKPIELNDPFDFGRSALFVDGIFDTETCYGWIVAEDSITAHWTSFGGNSVDFTGDGPLYSEGDPLDDGATFGATAGSPWLQCSVWVTLDVSGPAGDSPGALTLTVTSPVTGSNSASCTDNVPSDGYTCSVSSVNRSGAEADAHFLISGT